MFEAQSAAITGGLQNVHPSKIIDPDNEDLRVFEDFTRVIDNATLKQADKDADAVEVISDNFLGMLMLMTRGDKGEMVHAKVQKGVCDEEGKPVWEGTH